MTTLAGALNKGQTGLSEWAINMIVSVLIRGGRGKFDYRSRRGDDGSKCLECFKAGVTSQGMWAASRN